MKIHRVPVNLLKSITNPETMHLYDIFTLSFIFKRQFVYQKPIIELCFDFPLIPRSLLLRLY